MRSHVAEARPTVLERRPVLWSLRESWILRHLAEADIVSEGAVVTEAGRRVYYGSTSFSFTVDEWRTRAGEPSLLSSNEVLGAAFDADPMTRLYAVRIARREAASRAGGSLDVAYTDVRTTVSLEGAAARVRIDVDVCADVARLYERVRDS